MRLQIFKKTVGSQSVGRFLGLSKWNQIGAFAHLFAHLFTHLCVWGLLLCLAPSAQAQSTIYVDADNTSGTEDGTSWATAYTDLQDALAAATGTDAIWVADGTYVPGTSRSDSFTITGAQDGLRVYGGFQGLSRPGGGETALAQRRPVTYETVLSGDIGAPDDASDNVRHVLLLDGMAPAITRATVLDGLTVTGGNAEGDGAPENTGGGLLCRGEGTGNACSPTLVGVTFRANQATFGAGIFNEGDVSGASSPLIVNSLFVGNTAMSNGGAIQNLGRNSGTSNPRIVNTTIIGNTAGERGGGIFSNGDSGVSSPEVVNTILWSNEAPEGSELFNRDGTPALTHTLLDGGLTGGGVFNEGGGSVTDNGNNLDADPRFVDADGADDALGTADDDLRLTSASPALDVGTSAALPADTPDRDGDGDTSEPLPVDLAGATRLQGGVVDLGALEGVAATFVSGNSGLPNLRDAALAWGDVDGDGDLDLALAGNATTLFVPLAGIYRNDGNPDGDGLPTFTDLGVGLKAVASNPDVAWGDYDDDGDLDLLLEGSAVGTSNDFVAIYRNDGDPDDDGVPTFTELDAGDTGLPTWDRVVLDWGDYDSDGDLDLAISGLSFSSRRTRVYRQNSPTSFSNINAGLTNVINGAIAWGDYNGDGDLDLVVTGADGNGSARATIYKGNGAGGFDDIQAGLNGVDLDSSAAWGDYDGDGDLDLVVTGRKGPSGGPSTRVYRNDGDTDGDGTTDFASLGTSVTGLDGITEGAASWGDLDLDGDLDLLLTGLSSGGLKITRIYRYGGHDAFTRLSVSIQGLNRSDGAWADFDGDGDLDAAVAGEDASFNPFLRLIRNDRLTTPPDDATTASISGDERSDFGTTGLAIDFGPGTTPGSVTVSRFDTTPPDTDGLPSGENTSSYRFLITTDGNVAPGTGTTVRFDPSRLGGITAPGSVTVYTRPTFDTGTFVALPTTVENGEIVATVTGFSEFVLTSPSDPLPVELTAFDAQQQSDAVLLTWDTASEENNAGFEVQRRAAADWERIGFLEGAGTTTEAQTYRFRDAQLPFADSLVYRLRQIDTDGATAFSPEVIVRRGPGTEVALGTPFPNPVRQQATVRYVVPEGPAQSVRLDVYNVLGQRIATLVDETQAHGREEVSLNASRWASGVYFLRLQVGKTVRSQRVTVVR